jgi:hypothetical protein
MPLSVSRWLEERAAGVMFRLRLLSLAFQRLDDIPALVVMGLGREGAGAGLAEEDADSDATRMHAL